MRTTNRILGMFLLLAATITLFYWGSYFTGGEVRVIDARWYTAFESSFPVADGWMALCAALAGVGLLLGRPWGVHFGLMAGATLLYLAAMDITFDVENGLYALAAANSAMKFEIFINATCILLGAVTIVLCWQSKT